jgi:hypothetical protein
VFALIAVLKIRAIMMKEKLSLMIAFVGPTCHSTQFTITGTCVEIAPSL